MREFGEVVTGIMAVRLELMGLAGLYIAGIWYQVIPGPYPVKGAHRRRLGHPTWTRSPLYHALAVGRLGDVGDEEPTVRYAPGARSYGSLARLSRYSRAAAAPGKKLVVVRSPGPHEDL